MTGPWVDEYKAMAEKLYSRIYLQVWNEWRAFYPRRAGHPNNKLLARHRQRRHK